MTGLRKTLQHYKVGLIKAAHPWNCLLTEVTTLDLVEPRDTTKPKKSVFLVEGSSKDHEKPSGEDKNPVNSEIAELKQKIKELEELTCGEKPSRVCCFICKKKGHYARDCCSGKALSNKRSKGDLKEQDKSKKGSQN